MRKALIRGALVAAGGWALVTAGTLVVVGGAALAFGRPIQAWDDAVLAWLQGSSEPTLVAASKAVTLLGKPSAVIPLTTFAVLTWTAVDRRRDALWVLVSCVGAGASYLVLLPIFARPRPDTLDATGLAMPSGHAVATLALALPSAIAAWRAWGRKSLPLVIALAFMVVVVGVTRPYIQLHYVTDVLVAWALTIAWVLWLDRLVLPR